jgi:radical SAM protein with 4Fe4S-binding SPASM domain
LSVDIFEKLLPVIGNHHPWVNLSGHGETLTHPLFLEMFVAAANAGARGIEFQTNGTLLSSDLISVLLDTKKWERLKVSIDGACESTYEWIRGTRMKPVLSNIECFSDMRGNRILPGLTIEFCAMCRNIEEMPATVRLASDLGADKFVVGDLREYPGMEGQSLIGKWETARPHFEKSAEVAKEVGIEFCPSEAMASHMGRTISHPKAEGGVCHIPWTTAYIDVTGKVRPCCVVDEALGDLAVQTFEEAWFGSKATAFRKRFVEGDVPEICRKCTWMMPEEGDK